MRACLAWIAQVATQRIIGLQATTVRTRALPTKVEAASTMEEHPAGTAIRKRYKLPHARNATKETPRVGEVARAEGMNDFGDGIKHAPGKDACFSSH